MFAIENAEAVNKRVSKHWLDMQAERPIGTDDYTPLGLAIE
jgi:hypothetical protein